MPARGGKRKFSRLPFTNEWRAATTEIVALDHCASRNDCHGVARQLTQPTGDGTARNGPARPIPCGLSRRSVEQSSNPKKHGALQCQPSSDEQGLCLRLGDRDSSWSFLLPDRRATYSDSFRLMSAPGRFQSWALRPIADVELQAGKRARPRSVRGG